MWLNSGPALACAVLVALVLLLVLRCRLELKLGQLLPISVICKERKGYVTREDASTAQLHHHRGSTKVTSG